MAVVVHISDLHFGAEDAAIAAALARTIAQLAPDVVAVSGDLTQRARRTQFAAARDFLRSLPAPQVVVPGNHDVPLYDVLSRFGDPLGRFRRYITDERFPRYVDGRIAVVGADTTRSLTIKDGGLRPVDLQYLVSLLRQLEPPLVKIVVCHHPFDPPAGRAARLTRPAPAAGAMATLIDAGADVFLTGHLHLSYAGHSAVRYHAHGLPSAASAEEHRSAIVVEAGTATSTRARGEPNAFNVVRVDAGGVGVARLAWYAHDAAFRTVHDERFERTARGWGPAHHAPGAIPPEGG